MELTVFLYFLIELSSIGPIIYVFTADLNVGIPTLFPPDALSALIFSCDAVLAENLNEMIVVAPENDRLAVGIHYVSTAFQRGYGTVIKGQL